MEPMQDSDYSGLFHEKLLKQYTDFALLEKRKTSVLFRATKSGTETAYLVKVFDSQNQAHEDDSALKIESFIRKAFVQLKFKHANLLKIVDCDLDLRDSKLFVVFPYHPSLKQLLIEKKEINVIKMFNDIKSALIYARDYFQITHGTLNPESIYYDQAKDVYLVSRLTFPYVSLNQEEQNARCYLNYLQSVPQNYLSPELTMLNNLEEFALDIGLIDVYSLALVVLECLGIDRKLFAYLQTGIEDDIHYTLLLKGILEESSSHSQNSTQMKKLLFNMLQKAPEKRPHLKDIVLDEEPDSKPILEETVQPSMTKKVILNLHIIRISREWTA